MSFAENLKRIRKEQNLSQEELAELLDVSRQAVSKWEQGMGYPEVETLLLLSGKLNVSLDALMSSGFVSESDGQRKHAAGTLRSPRRLNMRSLPAARLWLPARCTAENRRRSMRFLASVWGVHRSGGSRTPFWDGMPIRNSFQKKWRRSAMPLEKGFRPIPCNTAQRLGVAGRG